MRPLAVCSTLRAAWSSTCPFSPITAVVALSVPALRTPAPCITIRRATTSPRLIACESGAVTSHATSGVRGFTSDTRWPAARITSPSGVWMRPLFSTCGATR